MTSHILKLKLRNKIIITMPKRKLNKIEETHELSSTIKIPLDSFMLQPEYSQATIRIAWHTLNDVLPYWKIRRYYEKRTRKIYPSVCRRSK